MLLTGDPQAMKAIYDRWSPLTYTVALALVGSPAAAEDVVRCAYLMLWRQRDAALMSHDSLQAYLVDAVVRSARELHIQTVAPTIARAGTLD
jgi:DNA-directed RNA polymerase specialized sigma24 family protein